MRILFSCLLALSVARAAVAGDNWPQFRGPNGDGCSDSRDLPLTWSESENVKWKTPVHGRAWSSPVISGDQVWLTTAEEKGHAFYAVCLDRKTGQIIHDLKLATADMAENTLITVAARMGVKPRSMRCGAWCRLTPACTG